MSEKSPNQNPRFAWLPGTAIAIVASLLLYIASIGPAWWALMEGYVSQEAFHVVFSPILNGEKTIQHLGLDEWLWWYVDLWHELEIEFDSTPLPTSPAPWPATTR